MKKFILLMMSFLFALIIVGCNGVTSSTTTEGTTQSTTESTTESSDTQPTSVTSDTYPVIEGAEDVTVEKNSSFIPLEGITAYDAEDGVIPTSEIQYSGNVNLMAVGEYEVSYTVVDNDGNVTTVYRTVTVVFTDTQGPLLAGVGPKTIYVGQDFDPTAGVSANDTIDGDVPVTYTGEVNIWETGDYTLTYAAEDESANETTQDRVITVTFGDFVFGDATTYAMGDFTLDGTLYSSSAFSGGVINTSIADFTYIKVELTATGSAAGTINVNLNDEVSSLDTVDVSTTEATTTIYYVISESLTDVSFTVADDEAILTDFSVDISFAEVRDMVAPVLNVPTAEIAYPVNYTQAGLEAELLKYVTAVDDIDGNITSEITIDYGTLDLTTAGEYEVIYSVIDAGGNETNYTRNVVIGNLIDSGFISDPTFQNEGDDQWIEKSNNGEASIAYDAVEGTMSITVTKLGDWLSAAGTYLKEPTSGLEVDTWYMFTFTVKTTIDRKLGFRMGLDTDEANGWIDDFNGRSDMTLDINGDYQTFTFFFKLDSLTSTAGYTDYKIELNLGNLNYSNIGVDGITTFKDVYMYKVVTEYDPPTYTLNQGADLPIKFTVGDAEPTWANYINFYDMSMVELTPTIDATAVDMNAVGVYDIIFTATDSRDMTTDYTLTIEVVSVENADTVGPVVTIKDGVPTTLDQFTNLGQIQLHQLVEAVDAEDGIITVLPEMVDDGGLNFNVAGVYTVTFTVYDLSGNITVEEFVVTINDKEAPVIGVNDFTVSLGDAFDPLFNVTVNDNVDGVLDPNDITITGLDAFVDGGYVNQEGKFELTYEIADAAGNVRTKTVAVEVISIEWDETTRTDLLGAQDEGPTHSTVTYNAVDDVYEITAIDTEVDPWDHSRLVYYFSDLEMGKTYKFEIMVKADVATDLYFRVGATLSVDPWIDNFTGGLRTISIGTEYVTYQVVFTVDKAMPDGTAKFQFMYGYLPTDATNTIYVKTFDIVQMLEEVPAVYEDVEDLLGTQDEGPTHSTVTYNEVDDVYEITAIDTEVDSWDHARWVYYFTGLEMDAQYRFLITVRADVATDLYFRVGSTLSVDPWIDDFTGGLKTVSITTEYVTYEVVFTVDKAMPDGTAKFQFMYGYLSTDATNTIYVSEFKLQKEVVPVVPSDEPIVFNDFEGYVDNTAYQADTTDNIVGTRIGGSAFIKTNGELIVDGENNYLIQDIAYASNGTNGIRIRISQADIPEGYQYLAVYIQATIPTGITEFKAYVYTAGGAFTDKTSTVIGDLSKIGIGTFIYIPLTSIQGDTAEMSVLINSSGAISGQLIFDSILFTKDFIVIPEPENEAPVITISDANLAAISGMTLEAGNSIETLLPSLLAMVNVNDAEDGVIETTQAMFNFGTLNPTNPVMGTYEIKINASDSLGLAATEKTFTINIVEVFEDFEAFTDDADFKANWSRIESFRVSGGSWGTTAATLTTDGDNNLLEFTYGPSTNGIKFDVTKAELVALGAEYIGIYVKTSAELVGTSNVFQAFHYVGGTFVQVTTYGTISYTDEGTYFYIKVSDLPEGLTHISLMINLASGNTGTMTMDNIVIK